MGIEIALHVWLLLIVGEEDCCGCLLSVCWFVQAYMYLEMLMPKLNLCMTETAW